MNKPEKRTIGGTDKLLRMYDKGFNHGLVSTKREASLSTTPPPLFVISRFFH